MDVIIKFLQEKGPMILTVLVIVVVGLILVKLVAKLIERALDKSRLDKTGHKFILALVRVALLAVVLITALSMLGVNITSMIAVFGVVGLAISLAVQDSLGNVAGGFILLFAKPFKVGDYVELDGLSGTVAQINILQTELKTYDNKAVFIPNRQVSAAKITNYSKQETRLLDLPYSIAYREDFERVKGVFAGVFAAQEQLLTDPAPCVRIKTYASSSVDLSVRAWVKTEDYWDVYFAMQEAVKRAFDENGISMPFPQLDVHLNSHSNSKQNSDSKE